MENKEIYIDGVDVSRCGFFDECEVKLDWSNCLAHCSPYPEGACYDDCSEHPNCYYKQLKRSEAQCEAMFVSHTDLEKKYKAKEQECERLRKTFDFVLEETIKEHRLYESKLERIIYEQL